MRHPVPDGVVRRRRGVSRWAIHLRRTELAEAEVAIRRAIDIREGRLGPDSAELAFPLDNLCAVLEAQGRTAEAVAVADRRKRLPEIRVA